jgi:hypothetical protein
MGQLGDLLAELTVQLTDLVGEGLDGGDLSLADPDLDQGAGVGGLGEPGGDATQAGAGEPAGGVFQVRVQLVQMPAQPVDLPGPLGDQVLTMVDQQLDLPGRLVMTGGGQIGFALLISISAAKKKKRGRGYWTVDYDGGIFAFRPGGCSETAGSCP